MAAGFFIGLIVGALNGSHLLPGLQAGIIISDAFVGLAAGAIVGCLVMIVREWLDENKQKKFSEEEKVIQNS